MSTIVKHLPCWLLVAGEVGCTVGHVSGFGLVGCVGKGCCVSPDVGRMGVSGGGGLGGSGVCVSWVGGSVDGAGVGTAGPVPVPSSRTK